MYNLPLPPLPYPLPPPFSPSLISLMVSVDVKHHVYLLLIRDGERRMGGVGSGGEGGQEEMNSFL